MQSLLLLFFDDLTPVTSLPLEQGGPLAFWEVFFTFLLTHVLGSAPSLILFPATVPGLSIELSLITLHWFLTAFASVVHIKLLLRLWDLFFYEGSLVLFQTTLGLLRLKVLLQPPFHLGPCHPASQLKTMSPVSQTQLSWCPFSARCRGIRASASCGLSTGPSDSYCRGVVSWGQGLLGLS